MAWDVPDRRRRGPTRQAPRRSPRTVWNTRLSRDVDPGTVPGVRVSSRSFYDLFPARRSDAGQDSLTAQESLLEELYIILNEEIGQALTTLTIPAGTSLLEATIHIVSTALTPMLSDERKARVLEVEAVGVSESLEARRRATMRMLAAAVDYPGIRKRAVRLHPARLDVLAATRRRRPDQSHHRRRDHRGPGPTRTHPGCSALVD